MATMVGRDRIRLAAFDGLSLKHPLIDAKILP